ncbi:MAG: hypothetical protein EZS28_038503, partial [Streblomastix strix]
MARQLQDQSLKKLSSNQKELQAVEWALNKFSEAIQTHQIKDILIQSDNSTVVQDLEKRSASTSLNNTLTYIYDYSNQLGVRTRLRHIPGATNLLADSLSRQQDGSDYQLKLMFFKQLCDQLRLEPQIDGLASAWNRQVPIYISWKKEIGAEATNALLCNLGDGRIWWLHPPIPILSQVVNKLIYDYAKAILITPDWRTLPCRMNLESKSVMSIKLPPTRECCIAGPGMEAAEATLPPEDIFKLIPGSSATKELILGSYAPGTLSHYQSALKHWISWCNVKGINPISNDPIDLANCMSDLFSSGKCNR